MEPAELSTMLKPFYAEARKVSGRKTIQSQHCESQFVPGWTDFFLVLFKEIIRDKVFKLANEDLKRSCAIWIDFFHKAQESNFQRRPWSPLCSKSAWSESSRKFANTAWFNTIFYFGKRGRENQREMKPGALQLNNNDESAEVLHLKRESDENQSTFKCSRFYTFCVSRL